MKQTGRAKLNLTAPEGKPALRVATEGKTIEGKTEGKGAADAPPTEGRVDRQGKKLIGGHFPKATWATLRDLGTQTEKNNQELLEEALADLFAKYRVGK